MRFVPAIIIAVALILAPLVWHFSRSLFNPVPTSSGSGGVLIDDTARIEIERLRGQIIALQETIARLETEVFGRVTPLESLDQPEEPGTEVTGMLEQDENTIAEDYATVVTVESRRRINRGLSVPPRSFLIETFGLPRENLGDNCAEPTNSEFADRLVLEDFGNFRVRLMRPAVDSLKRVFTLIQAVDPDLYERINTAGALCIRRIRGSNSISSHAFGLAIDLNIDGQLDTLGDGRTQLGLTIIADIFQNEGWLWGAAFGREDSMHFEVSKELIDQWIAQNRI